VNQSGSYDALQHGSISTYQLWDDSGLNLLPESKLLATSKTISMPLSLAVSGDRAFVANRWLGSIAFLTPYQQVYTGDIIKILGTLATLTHSSRVTVVGTEPSIEAQQLQSALTGESGLPPIFGQVRVIVWLELNSPQPPSNLQTFDL